MTVLVGVDGSPGSRAAIRVAAREAGYRQAPLVAVMAYSGERVLGAPATRPVATLRTSSDQRLDALGALSETVADALGDQADEVEQRVVLGLAGRKLVESARQAGAELIVLAARHTGSLLLGTVSQYVLRNAPCPVLVVPATTQRDL